MDLSELLKITIFNKISIRLSIINSSLNHYVYVGWGLLGYVTTLDGLVLREFMYLHDFELIILHASIHV